MLALTLLLAACPQNPLVLPPRRDSTPVQAVTPERTFEQDVAVLRRSRLGEAREDELIGQLAGRYPDLAQRAVALARTADPDLLDGLLRILARVAGPEQAQQVVTLSLTRPLGAAAARAMEVVASLPRPDAKAALLRCLAARSSGTRRAAANALKPLLDAADADLVLDAMQRGGRDVYPLALELLGATPTAAARRALLDALASSDANAAALACEALVAHGPAPATDLQTIIGRAAAGRAFGYAAVALTELERRHGVALQPDAAVPCLRQEIDSHDPFMRVAAAVALAQLSYRSGDEVGERYGDRAIVDGLLLVVAPGAFVTSYSLLQPLALAQLHRLTGRAFALPTEWEGWWTSARAGFVGRRQSLAIDGESAALASLTLIRPGQVVRVRGERAPEPLQMAAEDEVFVLPAAEMAQLVQRLQDAGFMSPALEQGQREAAAVPRTRTLELRLGAVRSSYEAPARDDAWMDRFVTDVEAVALAQRWQLYHGGDDFMAFWRSERAWLLAHPDRSARDQRMKELIVAALPRLQGELRTRALEHLNEVPKLATFLSESDGLAIAAAVRDGGVVDADGERLLALALRVDSEPVVKAVLDVTDELAAAGGREALPRLFAMMGAERVLRCVADPRPQVKIAAMHEIANMRELQAVPALLVGLRADDVAVQQTAIWALGILRSPDARQPLLDALPTLVPEVRRVAWVALGRIGGDGVLAAILRGTTFDDVEDKRAAIAALGKLDEPTAADYLASLFVAAGQGPLGDLVLGALHDQGALRARTALRKSLQASREARVRDEVVQVLADFNDPSVVPDLIGKLADVRDGARAAAQLSAITGVDVARSQDPAATMLGWWSRHKDESQAEWFLDAVRAAGIPTDLDVAKLQPRAGVDGVSELARILTATDQPHLRLLALALLRDTTQRDFGAISPQARPEELIALADRYRIYAESVVAGGK
ncbi:MAG: HEAT repeat domain-containing protein [Planctomycetota bacterium]